jgi:hypothetical protein
MNKIKLEMAAGTQSHANISNSIPLPASKCRRRKTAAVAGAAILAACLLPAIAPPVQAQTRLGPSAPVTYDNKWEVYGGLNYMNFTAGQDLPLRMNLGGGEFEGTYWLTSHLGIAADYRGEAGTTQVLPNAQNFGIHRPLVYMNMGMFGAQYRGPRNQHAALDFHAYGGMAHGVFDAGTAGAGVGDVFPPAVNAQLVGLYSDRTSPIFAVGASGDFNRSKNLAIRLSPDLIIEHFGTETRTFFAISGGVVYRFPLKKKK